MHPSTLGLLAGAITTLAIVPQVVKTWRTRQARDISLWQPVLLEIGMLLWFVYGLLLQDLPLLIANGFSLFCNGLLIAMKLRFRELDKTLYSDYRAPRAAYEEEL